MPEETQVYDTAPIIEAIVEIECNMPHGFSLDAVKQDAQRKFLESYPIERPHYVDEHRFEIQKDDQSEHSRKQMLVGFRFFSKDEKQIVQIKRSGFSFNRLAPYSTLDDYLDEIKRRWEEFVAIAKPLSLVRVELRYINRFLLPIENQTVDLSRYLTYSPRLPFEDKVSLRNFLHQYTFTDPSTAAEATTVLASQAIKDAEIPIILDIQVSKSMEHKPDDWNAVLNQIRALRKFKNQLFENNLTESCKHRFKQRSL